MTSKENLNENLHKPISGIFAKKSVGPHCNALLPGEKFFIKTFKNLQFGAGRFSMKKSKI
jgi:hypothetical protein